jgi:mono/diheme cytochrome c family protein
MVKRAIAILFLVGVLGLLLIQLVPYGRDHTNAAVVREPAWDSPATRATAVIACFDCHSNETVWPWYSNIAPISWLLQHDVDEGRKKLNFSNWTEGQGLAAPLLVESDKMPPLRYVLAHPEARLSDADKAALIEGLTATLNAPAD